MNKPLADQPHSEIVKELNRRNRRFKQFTILFMITVAVGLIVIILVGLNNLQRANAQLEQQKALLEAQNQTIQAVKDQGDKRTEQLEDISKQIDCIAKFFTQRNRTDAVITDLEQCKILNSDGTTAGSTSSPKADSGDSSATPRSQEPANISPNTPGLKPDTPNKPEQPPDNNPLHRIPVLGGLLKRIGL